MSFGEGEASGSRSLRSQDSQVTNV